METEQRNQFTFYRSYLDAISMLPKKEQLMLFHAIARYALGEEIPEGLSPVQSACFKLIQPTLDNSRKKAACGKQNGSKSKAKRKQNESKTEANREQTANEKENEREKEKEKDILPPVAPRGAEGGFESFWSLYPKKVGKDAARKAWAKTKGVPLEGILSAVRSQKESGQWQRDGGQYIPNPATWLNQGRWQDELPPEVKKPGDIHGCGAMGQAELDAISAVLATAINDTGRE